MIPSTDAIVKVWKANVAMETIPLWGLGPDASTDTTRGLLMLVTKMSEMLMEHTRRQEGSLRRRCDPKMAMAVMKLPGMAISILHASRIT